MSNAISNASLRSTIKSFGMQVTTSKIAAPGFKRTVIVSSATREINYTAVYSAMSDSEGLQLALCALVETFGLDGIK